MASCSHVGFVTSLNDASSRGSELVPLLLLWRLLIGMAIGLPVSLSVRWRPRLSLIAASFRGPSEMYSAHWNWHTTYGSTLGRRLRPSEMATDSLPFGGPTSAGGRSRLSLVLVVLEVEVEGVQLELLEVGYVPKCVKGVEVVVVGEGLMVHYQNVSRRSRSSI